MASSQGFDFALFDVALFDQQTWNPETPPAPGWSEVKNDSGVWTIQPAASGTWN